MPSPAEGLTFGDFTAEEWEKFFKRPAAQFGNSPPVEFLFEFEYSDNEEPNHYDGSVGQKLCDESSSAARNVAAGPEDSGVEVGQESEQEITPAKPAKQPTGGVKLDDKSKLENAVDDLPQAEPMQDVAEPASQPAGQGSGPQQIVFAGNSIVKEMDPAKKSASAPSSPESDSFPPLQSTVTSQIEKQAEIKPENERSRKRRKRRKQRKRSGSVSSSSSECSEKERGSLNAVNAKGKTSAGMLLASEKEAVKVETPPTLDKEQQKDRNTSADERKALQRHDTSSGDGQVKRKSSSSTGDISNSPTHSDTDAKITVTVNNVQLDCKPVQGQTKTVELIASEQSTKPSSADKEAAIKKEPPKPCSWADLFKNSPKPSPGIVIKVGSAAAKVETKVLSGPKKTEEPAQTTVKVQEDKHAKRLAEIIQKVELNYLQKPFIPRGLTNRGNWCYVNATLQALAGCPPFFNLLRELPLIKDRGPTSTPILDSLTSFMNEFKNPSAKPGANSGMPSKAEFNPGESWEPSNVYKMLSVIQSSLSAKGRQEDAQEFLSCVLNGMHEEMLQLSKMVSSSAKVQEQQTDREVLPETDDPVVNGEDVPEEEEDDGDWEQVGPRNKSMVTRMASYPQSLISNMFGGYLRSSVHQTGLKDSANVEPFFELHLDVQTVTSVEEALKNLVLKEEVQGYTCTKTKAQVDISRRVTLEELPKVLILHLKRFIYSKSGSQKLQKVIDYPLELTIGKELLSPNVRNKYPAAQKTYKLFAVVYHHGKNAWGGHYTTDVLQPVHGWVRADDTRLKVVPMNYVLKPTQGKDPYVLFYRRTDLMP